VIANIRFRYYDDDEAMDGTLFLLFIVGNVQDVKRLVALQSGAQQSNLPITLHALRLSIYPGTPVAVGLVRPGHLVDTGLVLLLDLELKLELVKHARDLGCI
jgi:hypothetical protein